LIRHVWLAALATACELVLCAVQPIKAQERDEAAARACNDGPHVRQLSRVVNSRDRNFECLGITVADGAIVAVRFERHDAKIEPHASDIGSTEYPTALIESPNGAVLDGTPGHDAIILRGRFRRPSTGGEFVIRYLYNGITNEWRQCVVSIHRSPADEWHLFDALHRTVSIVTVKMMRTVPFLGAVGIATLAGACTDG
jgi:hypothetical protein